MLQIYSVLEVLHTADPKLLCGGGASWAEASELFRVAITGPTWAGPTGGGSEILGEATCLRTSGQRHSRVQTQLHRSPQMEFILLEPG